MSSRKACLWAALVAAAAYANSLGNGFAYDDATIVVQNPVVQDGRPGEAFGVPYWPRHAPGSGLYRPVTVATFAVEWPLFGGNPTGFHAVNVALHALVSALVVLVLARFVSTGPALLGGLVFAVHPLHAEAVANVVGRGELLAALFSLTAVLVYLAGREWGPEGRALRLLAIGPLYLLALGSKEIAVTLPAVLVLLELLRRGSERPVRRVLAEWPVFTVLAAALVGYLTIRASVLGGVLGELPAPELRDLGGAERVLTALSLWPHYLRLLLFPFDLSVDYSPGVLFPARSITPEVVGGALTLAAFGVGSFLAWRRSPALAMGFLWFLVTVLPVSHLLFPTGVLLAERTLYLPSVGVAWLAAAAWTALASGRRRPRLRWAALAGAGAVLAAFLVRTVDRNPTWMSTFTVLQTLVREHPESSLALRTVGASNVRAGDPVAGLAAYEAAARLAPFNYSVLTEVGHFHGERGAWEDAERVLSRALEVAPDRPAAYRLLAGQYLLQARYREGHGLALAGLARAGSDRELWALVSESYIAKGDFEAALRARRAALGRDPTSAQDLRRLADIHDLMGDQTAAAAARRASEQAERSAAARPTLNAVGRLERPPERGEGT